MAVAHTTAVGLVGANLFITINRIILGSFSNIAIGIGTCYFLAPTGPVHGAIRLTQRNNHANISELLDNLLRGYDNSIRPDFGGKRWTHWQVCFPREIELIRTESNKMVQRFVHGQRFSGNAIKMLIMSQWMELPLAP
uniref:Neurotransmitter-gated ion-channel ligand-binding domain-containing protein n=1 Tax=Anopheles culicifacies TaxID=139723 RepID=A0A182MCF2_9DIPT